MPRHPSTTVTPTQLEVAKLLASGHRVRETAALLGTTENNVETQRNNLYRKLGFSSIALLTHWAIGNGHIKCKF